MGKIKFLLIVSVFVAPFMFAQYFSMNNATDTRGTTNHGVFLSEEIDITPQKLSEDEHWIILQVIPTICDKKCQEITHMLRQINTALGKDMGRVARYILHQENPSKIYNYLNNYPKVIVLENSESLYNKLQERGYKTHIWPARFPDEETVVGYGNKLASFISNQLQNDVSLVGQPTDPNRFSEFDLLEREASYGRSGFALQFMLDTRLSDALRYPLKVSDLIIMDIPTHEAPEKLSWSSDEQYIIQDLPNVSFSGDHYHRPMFMSDDFVEYTGSVMSIDPSGRGKDETGYAVVKMLNGYQYVRRCGGIAGGYTEEVLQKLANIAKEEGVNEIIVESNFGDGMFSQLFTPTLNNIYPCTINEVRHSKQKELRIIDVLEPVMNQHRLIVDKKVIKNDFESCQHLPPESALRYQLMYQLTRITRDRGALVNDDRLDALAMAVQYWVDAMAQDVENRMAVRRDQAMQDELKRMQLQHAAGFAILTGHNLQDTSSSTYKW